MFTCILSYLSTIIHICKGFTLSQRPASQFTCPHVLLVPLIAITVSLIPHLRLCDNLYKIFGNYFQDVLLYRVEKPIHTHQVVPHHCFIVLKTCICIACINAIKDAQTSLLILQSTVQSCNMTLMRQIRIINSSIEP